MADRDIEKWEQKHRLESAAAPARTLSRLPHAVNGQVALDLACGQGRNTGRLVELGYSVVAADISRRGLEWLASKISDSRARRLLVQCDLDDWPFSHGVFDLVVQCDFLDRSLFPFIRNAVKPGGMVLIDTFLQARRLGGAPTGPANPAYRLRPGELDDVFNGWRVLARSEQERPQPRSSILVRRPHHL